MDGLESYLNEIRKLLKQTRTKDMGAAKMSRAREAEEKTARGGRRRSMGRIIKTELSKVDGVAGTATPMSNGTTELEDDEGLGGCKLFHAPHSETTADPLPHRWFFRCRHALASPQEERGAHASRASGTAEEEASGWQKNCTIGILMH